jgi:hypothetical protein
MTPVRGFDSRIPLRRIARKHWAKRLKSTRQGSMRPVRLARMVSRERVAQAVVRAVERPRFEVWVPGYMGLLYAGSQLMPRPARDRIERLSGLDQVATQIARADRDFYEARVFSR